MITGSLTLDITGLPDGVDAGVTVTGPGGFTRAVTSSGALAGLVPGSYTVAATAVQASGQTFAPSAPQAAVDVAPGGTGSSAVVAYAISTGGVAVTIAGLPSGATAGVTLNGPSGFTRAITASETVTNLAPGTYIATASAITAGSDAYAAAPASQSVSVAASMTPSPITVTYSVTTGKLALVVGGLPSGANGAITVIGPSGFSALATGTQTFTGLHPGTYVVTAATIVDGADTYTAAPATQSVDVPASVAASTS
jgi:hypothetical protein